MIKWFIAFCMVLGVTFMSGAVTYADSYVTLQVDNPDMNVNGDIRPVGTAPVIRNGSTLVPLRSVVEALGSYVEWDNNERKITIKTQNSISQQSVIELWIYRDIAVANGERKPLEVPPTIISGNTMIPLRFISENLGFNVKWVESDRTIIISSKEISPALEAEIKSPSTTNSVTMSNAHGDNEVWYDYGTQMWAIGNPVPKDYGINWAVSDLDGDGKITSADHYLFDLPRANMIETLKTRPEYDMVLAWYQGVGTTTDLSGLWLTRPADTIDSNQYLSALCEIEGIRRELMQLDQLFSDTAIVINENERKKLDKYYDELVTCRSIYENSTIANYRKVHGTGDTFGVSDQAAYNTIKNNTAKWVMLYGTPEQKAAEPAYKPFELPDAPESVEPTNPIQETMSNQLKSANE